MESRSPRRRRIALLPAAVIALAAACGESDAPDDVVRPVLSESVPRVLAAKAALSGAHIPEVDPATMNDAEIRRVLESGPRCVFRYTGSGEPVLAMHMKPDGMADAAVVKLNGSLVALEAAANDEPAPEEHLFLRADPVRIRLIPDREQDTAHRDPAAQREADMIFEVGQSLRAGYRGYLSCVPAPKAGSAGGRDQSARSPRRRAATRRRRRRRRAAAPHRSGAGAARTR